MGDWFTLSKQDGQYLSYLQGTFSNQVRAIPQRPMDGRVNTNFMTFRLVAVEMIKRPALWKIWWRALRPSLLTLSLSPCLVIWGMSLLLEEQTPRVPIWQVLNVLLVLGLFQASLHLLNDYFDHMSGKDRADDRTGSRIIQNGWLPAYALYRFGVGLMLSGALLALPILWEQNWLVWGGALAALLGGGLFSLAQSHRLWLGVQELILFVLAGPMLTASFYYLLFGQWSWWASSVGIFFGLLAAAAFHLNHLEEIFLTERSGRRTLVGWLGFERSKRLLYLILGGAALSLLTLIFAGPMWPVASLGLLFFLFLVGMLTARIHRSPSFASSGLIQVRYAALRIHWLLGLFLSVSTALLSLYKNL